MTSFVVASTDKKKRELYIKEYCDELNIGKFDITLIEKDSTTKNIGSIGIDEIKEIHKKIFLKPLQSEVKAVILEDAHLLTIQAQNALLKVLEEPPEHTIIILGVDTPEALLPTILSRCQVIELSTEKNQTAEGETSEYLEFIENFSTMRIGEKLKKAEEIGRDKDKAVEWLSQLIFVLRDQMLRDPENTIFFKQIKSFQKLHTTIKTTNVNPRFAIENTLLNINY